MFLTYCNESKWRLIKTKLSHRLYHRNLYNMVSYLYPTRWRIIRLSLDCFGRSRAFGLYYAWISVFIYCMRRNELLWREYPSFIMLFMRLLSLLYHRYCNLRNMIANILSYFVRQTVECNDFHLKFVFDIIRFTNWSLIQWLVYCYCILRKSFPIVQLNWVWHNRWSVVMGHYKNQKTYKPSRWHYN